MVSLSVCLKVVRVGSTFLKEYSSADMRPQEYVSHGSPAISKLFSQLVTKGSNL